ncbi:ATP-binding cassette domain-containing protein [Chitinophaga sedimenti]|uniref:ABC transporter ATP-binding protein n=1 Tax=Chitinophaga sedimenti TaxID=2033606 RepID=UPI0020035F36|nr:ATP-binding cassette domain-containing protein [Chitinophaga sedimenti]MCK7559214.1 ATP-binding cassette domain-containing protein [Chitinophaga sedimenti]
MTISLNNVGKRFNYDWIFRGVTHTFSEGQQYAILGHNGSGKSTLLQVISGHLHHNEGKLVYTHDGAALEQEYLFRHSAIAAPYLELVEEFTLQEIFDFHQTFKRFIPGFKPGQIMEAVGLEKAVNKQVRNFSSGMKQRAKLAPAIFSDVPLLLLDEPCTNLDAEGVALYQRLIAEHAMQRTVIVSSNDPDEYNFCQQLLRITDYK